MTSEVNDAAHDLSRIAIEFSDEPITFGGFEMEYYGGIDK